MSIPEVFPRPTEPLSRQTREPGRRPPYTTGTSETGIRPAAQGVTLTREPGLDVLMAVARAAEALQEVEDRRCEGPELAPEQVNAFYETQDIDRMNGRDVLRIALAALASEDRP